MLYTLVGVLPVYDLVKLQLPFKSEFVKQIFTDALGNYTGGEIDLKIFADYGFRLAAGSIEYNEFGEAIASRLHHPYESLASSNSTLAFKVYAGGQNYFPFIELKASPAKLLQGHNVYGSTDVEKCFMAPLEAFILSEFGTAFYDLCDYANIEVAGFDVTKMAQVRNRNEAVAIVKAMGSVATGQIKPTHSYDTSCMWNGGSKNSVLKAYIKDVETERYIDQLQREIKKRPSAHLKRQLEIMQTDSVLEMAKNAIRFEASKHKKWMKKRGIPTNLFEFIKYTQALEEKGSKFDEMVWIDSFQPIFDTFEGVNVNTFDDESVLKELKAQYLTITKTGKTNYSKALRVFRFFKAIKSEGWDSVKQTTPEKTFYRNVAELTAVVPKAQLMMFDSKEKSNVIPLVRMINVDFKTQTPTAWQEPPSMREQLSQLRAVG